MTASLIPTSRVRFCVCGHEEDAHDFGFVWPTDTWLQRLWVRLVPGAAPCTDRNQVVDGVVQPCSCSGFVVGKRSPK